MDNLDIYVSSGNPNYSAQGNILYNKAKTKIIGSGAFYVFGDFDYDMDFEECLFFQRHWVWRMFAKFQSSGF